jgi:hypothetical protein
VQGLLSIDTIAEKMREGEHAAEFDQELPVEADELGGASEASLDTGAAGTADAAAAAADGPETPVARA